MFVWAQFAFLRRYFLPQQTFVLCQVTGIYLLQKCVLVGYGFLECSHQSGAHKLGIVSGLLELGGYLRRCTLLTRPFQDVTTQQKGGTFRCRPIRQKGVYLLANFLLFLRFSYSSSKSFLNSALYLFSSTNHARRLASIRRRTSALRSSLRRSRSSGDSGLRPRRVPSFFRIS